MSMIKKANKARPCYNRNIDATIFITENQCAFSSSWAFSFLSKETI